MADLTPTQKLAGVMLGQPVLDWLQDRRRDGLSWRLIARELRARTNGQIDITHETLRIWVEEAERVA